MADRCPHLAVATGGPARCTLAEFSLYALTEESGRLRRGLERLRELTGPPPLIDRGQVLTPEQVRLVEVRALVDEILGHTVAAHH